MDVADMSRYIQKINETAASLGRHIVRKSPRIFAINEEAALFSETTELHQSVAEFSNLAKASLGRGLWVVSSASVLANAASRSALCDDYATKYRSLFAVPGSSITAAYALPYPESTTVYQPVLDLRIQTSADKPLSSFEGPGNVVDRPGLGSWFRFPLADLKLAILG